MTDEPTPEPAPTMTDAERAVLTGDGYVEDDNGDWCDASGNIVPPSHIAATIVEAERSSRNDWPKPDAQVGKGPNATDSPALQYPPGSPPGEFVMPGTAIDSDGLAGRPAEMQAAVEGYADALDTNDGFASIGLDDSVQGREALQQGQARQAHEEGGPPPRGIGAVMATAQQEGAAMLGRVQARAHGVVTPGGMKSHREVVSGQYASIPGGKEVATGHEVSTFDLAQPAHADALRGKPSTSAPNGPPPGPDDRPVVAPTMRVLDPEKIKGSSL